MIRLDNTQYFHFLQQADALRRSGTLCDAIISVKSQTFRAHRLVLACVSRTLAQQLAQGDIDSPVHCTLENFSPHTFEQVLDFTYTQALEVSVDDLRLLLRAARQLEMQLLEDQCQKQLDSLSYRAGEEHESGENTDVKEEKEEKDQKQSPVSEEKLQEACSPVEKAHIAMKNPTQNNPQSPRKKPRLSPTVHNRDSLISRPTASSSSFSSPWTFSANMWDSVSTLRRIAQNYSDLIAAHPIQSPNQSSVAYPFSLSTPHMFPLLSPHFQTPGQNSVMGCSGFHPRYTQNLYAGSARMGSIIKQGLLKRKKPNQRAFIGTNVQTGEPRQTLRRMSLLWKRRWCAERSRHERRTQRRKTLPVPTLFQKVQSEASAGHTPPSSHRGEALRVSPLWPAFPGLFGHDQAPADSRRRGALPVHGLPGVLQQPGGHAETRQDPRGAGLPCRLEHRQHLPVHLPHLNPRT
uniref:BTB domain-containing protein n=1 Tax=Amphiprion ocellaris TaxID=80972 RepID=A0A3Q1C3W0_AMPOC